jgi:hypothetical protein
MGSNQQQLRYTGIQSQISQGSPSIGVANFQPVDMSGIMKTVGAIQSHIDQTQDANRQVDYTVLVENLKAQEAQDAQVLNTQDPNGYVTVQGEEPMLYSDYIKRSTETKQGYLLGFKNTWNSNRHQTDSLGVNTRSMLELLPLDQQKAMKTAELNLAHIQLGENLALVANSPKIGLRIKFDAMNRAIDLASTSQDNRNQLKLKFIGVAVNQTLTQHGATIQAVETEALKSSQGNQELYQKTMDAYYNSPSYQNILLDLNDSLDAMLNIPALSQLSIEAQSKLDAQGQQAYLESVKAQAKQAQGIIQMQAKMALQAGSSATSFALGGGYDSESVSQSMAALSKVINNPYVPKETKMIAEQQVKQLVEAKKLGVQLQKNPLGIDVSKIKDPELGAMVLKAQEMFKADQIRLEEKRQNQIDRTTDVVTRVGSEVIKTGFLDTASRLALNKEGVPFEEIVRQYQIIPVDKETFEKQMRNVSTNDKQVTGLYNHYQVKIGTPAYDAFMRTYGEISGITDQQTLHSVMKLSDSPQEAFAYLQTYRISQKFDTLFKDEKKGLIDGLITSYGNKKNALLFKSTNMLPPPVFNDLVLAQTVQDVGENGVFGKDGKLLPTFIDKFESNYDSLGNKFLSKAKKNTQSLEAVENAIRTGQKVNIPQFGKIGFSLTQNSSVKQSIPTIGALASVNQVLEKTGASRLLINSADRVKSGEHGNNGRIAFDVTDNVGSPRETQQQLYSLIVGLNSVGGKIKLNGHGSKMHATAKALYEGGRLSYLTETQMATLRKIMKNNVISWGDEGAKADKHFHISVVPNSNVSKYVPVSVQRQVGAYR